jgi:peptide/nickel transport system permease protein
MSDTDLALNRADGMSRNVRMRRHGLSASGLAGVLLLTAIVLLAMFAPLIAPHDPSAQNLAQRLIPPVWYEGGTWDHIFGTDNLGRDYFSRIIYGARISLLIGFAVMVISGLIGTVLGVVAGYFGGRIDTVVTFIIALRLALPVTLVALAVVAILGGSLPIVILVLGLLKWDRFAVVMRAATQQLRALDYVTAAEVAGASAWRILTGEILPNLMPQLVVVASVEAASAILLEAALSFLGLGVQPPLPSWGLMISEAKAYMFFSFWQIALPGTALAMLVLAINLLGEGVRDVAAPAWRV